jgi:hypothetical protein
LIGLAGPSGGGKTFSALRLATGMQRVSGGDVYVIDTESKRSTHYADKFKFRSVDFAAPFGPLDYLAAIEHCHKKGAGVIVVDSMSHEHEGPGGVLEMHAAEVQRMAGGDYQKAERVKMLAWAKPKGDRRRLINSLLQIQCNFIFCFRAKEKLKIERGKEPTKLGFMPIAGEEFVYEMTANALLMPNAGGVPTWLSEEIGERMMIKLPEQFRDLFLKHKAPLDERIGEEMARWAAGTAVAPKLVDQLEATLRECRNREEVEGFKPTLTANKSKLTAKEQARLRDVINELLGHLPDAVEAGSVEGDNREVDDGYQGDHTLPGMAAPELAAAH